MNKSCHAFGIILVLKPPDVNWFDKRHQKPDGHFSGLDKFANKSQ